MSDFISVAEQESLFRQAFELWGESLQKDIAIEEMAELTKELIKERREEPNFSSRPLKVVEEIADVLIMLFQLRQLYGEDNVDRVMRAKMERLKNRIEKAQK